MTKKRGEGEKGNKKKDRWREKGKGKNKREKRKKNKKGTKQIEGRERYVQNNCDTVLSPTQSKCIVHMKVSRTLS